jgi:hypothetical protein
LRSATLFVGRQPTRDLMGEQPAALDLGGEVGDPVFQRLRFRSPALTARLLIAVLQDDSIY